MTKRRKIAVAYIFAVPLVMAIVFFQHLAIIGVRNDQRGMVQAADALQAADSALALLKQAAAAKQVYVANTSEPNRNSFQQAVEQLRGALRQLPGLTKGEASLQSQVQAFDMQAAKGVDLLQQEMNLSQRAPAAARAALEAQLSPVMEESARTNADLRAALLARLQKFKGPATQSANTANAFTTFGGILAIWLVGMAALLLFHEDKRRAWTGLERRVHTKILEVLPLGVCLTSEHGSVLYANPAEESLFDYPSGELVAKDAARLHAPDGEGPSAGQGLFERLESAAHWSGEHYIRKKGGETLKTFLWMTSFETPGHLYRLIVHAPREAFEPAKSD